MENNNKEKLCHLIENEKKKRARSYNETYTHTGTLLGRTVFLCWLVTPMNYFICLIFR